MVNKSVELPRIENVKLGVIGLGYVGLPLAVEFGKEFTVVGYDINENRIKELASGYDRTLEITSEELFSSKGLSFTAESKELTDVAVYIVTTPTPIDEYKKPDLSMILSATRTIASTMNRGDVVIYESTVYPGVTEEECVPLIEEITGFKLNQEFFVGYSPERINPGDKTHRLTTIVKVTSGSTPEAADFIDDLYRKIIIAGTHKASSIRVAEAAKVIENTQRDVNIALINELALLFNKMGIDTESVLEAAGTKWNFLPFRPGLVGGHCIGVDPYYLTYKAQSIGHNPEMILAGRRINDSMGGYVASQVVKALLNKESYVPDARVLILGITFKENTPDIRNTRVVDIIAELQAYGMKVDVYDPWADSEEVMREYGIRMLESIEDPDYSAIIIAVAHEEFRTAGIDGVKAFGSEDALIYDLKHLFSENETDLRL